MACHAVAQGLIRSEVPDYLEPGRHRCDGTERRIQHKPARYLKLMNLTSPLVYYGQETKRGI